MRERESEFHLEDEDVTQESLYYGEGRNLKWVIEGFALQLPAHDDVRKGAIGELAKDNYLIRQVIPVYESDLKRTTYVANVVKLVADYVPGGQIETHGNQT